MLLGGDPVAELHAPAPASEDGTEAKGWDWKITSRGLEFSPAEWLHLRLAGRINYDVAEFDSDLTPIPDEHGFRRVRISLGGDVGEDWSFFLENDVGGTIQGWKDAWLRYKGISKFELTAGNQLAPFSLDELTSSDDTLFLERALPNALSAGYYVGLSARAYGDSWSTAAGLFGNPLDSEPRKRSDGQSVDARVTWAPWLHEKESDLLHVGASFEYRDVDSGSRYRIRTRPENGLTDVRLIDTRNLLDVKDTWSGGVELLSTLGPVTTQGEYILTRLDRESGDVGFGGWYVQGSYVLTGEGRAYNARMGRLRSLTPESSWGALELAARWSTLDLTDELVLGGEESNTTFGLNWYINTYVRVMADYTFIHAHPNKQGFDEDAELLALRLQVGF